MWRTTNSNAELVAQFLEDKNSQCFELLLGSRLIRLPQRIGREAERLGLLNIFCFFFFLPGGGWVSKEPNSTKDDQVVNHIIK